MPFVQTAATVVTIFAGVNEVNTVTAALGGGAGGSDPNGYMDTQVQAFGADYATLDRWHQGARGLGADHRAQRAERGGTAVSRRTRRWRNARPRSASRSG